MGKRKNRDETKEEKAARKLAKKQKKEKHRKEKRSPSKEEDGEAAAAASVSSTPKKTKTKQSSTKKNGTSHRTPKNSEASTPSSTPTAAIVTKNHRHFVKKRIQLAISLLPGSLKNTEESIENSLRSMLLKYSNGLGGILMAFENVKIIQDEHSQGKGFILNELPYIHYTVECTALVFAPVIGSEVCTICVSE
jgi:hypothetical protein